jgi:UDP-N-acetylenolpyruvoylglucosamine reductase
MIDELGMKGTRRGGAVVSEKHANFIVTEGEEATPPTPWRWRRKFASA